jgi:predicted transcriptional regulator
MEKVSEFLIVGGLVICIHLLGGVPDHPLTTFSPSSTVVQDRCKEVRNMSPKVSDAEMEILRLIIEMGEGNTSQIYGASMKIKSWAPGTVVTFVRRLEVKGYLEHTLIPGSKAYLYRPTAKAKTLRRGVVKDLLERVFGGNPLPIVSYLLEEKTLTRKELTELKRLIEEHEKKGGRKP